MKVKLLAVTVGLLLLLGMLCSDAQNVVLTSNRSGQIFCNGTEVIFTCETRGSASLEWSGDDYYVGNNPVTFTAELDSINLMIQTKPYTTATLTRNNRDGVLVSTLRTVVSSDAPSGIVICTHSDAGTRQNISFQVLAPPAVPQDVVSFQLEHIQDTCAIACVLRSPASEATYTVSMDGSSVPHKNEVVNSAGEDRHSALVVHNSSCGAHRISISANNMCGEGPGTDEIMLDPERRIVLSVNSPNSANNNIITTTEGSSQVYQKALIGVTISMAVLAVGTFVLGCLCGYLCKKYQLFNKLHPKCTSEDDSCKKK